MKCEVHPDLCHSLDCFMKPVNRTRTKVSVLCLLKKPIEEMKVFIAIETKNSKNIYSTWMNETVDYCKNIGKGNIDVFGLVERLLEKSDARLVPHCPIKAKRPDLLFSSQSFFLHFRTTGVQKIFLLTILTWTIFRCGRCLPIK